MWPQVCIAARLGNQFLRCTFSWSMRFAGALIAVELKKKVVAQSMRQTKVRQLQGCAWSGWGDAV